MKKIVFLVMVLLSFAALGKELVASNGKRMEIKKVNLDQYGSGLDWYAEKYPDISYCQGPGDDNCDDNRPNCIDPAFDFHCTIAMEEMNDFTAEQIKSLIQAILLGKMNFDWRATDFVQRFYKVLYEYPDDKKFASVKDYAYSKEVLEQVANIRRFEILLYIPQTLPYYRDIIKDAVQKAPGLLKNLPENIRDDKEIVLIVLNSFGGEEFKYVSSRLRDDKEVVLTVLNRTSSNAYDQYVSPRLLKDPDILAAQAKYEENKKEGQKRFLEKVEKAKKEQLERRNQTNKINNIKQGQ